MAPKKDDDDDCGCRDWILAIVYNGLFYLLLTLVLWMGSTTAYDDNKPTMCAVELAAGVKGLEAPGGAVAATSPAFDLVMHVTNGHTHGLNHGGGDVVVSYAGVPLARGRTPALELGCKAVAALPVEARSAGVGVPGDLFRLMAGERRWGVAQLQVEFGFASDRFVCEVLLDAQAPRVFPCYAVL